MGINILERPCLVLIWKNRGDHWECLYRLLIPLGEHDIRGRLLRVKMGGTTVRSGDPNWTPKADGKLGTPFRDGAHIKWDSKLLNVPMYVVWGKEIQPVEHEPDEWINTVLNARRNRVERK